MPLWAIWGGRYMTRGYLIQRRWDEMRLPSIRKDDFFTGTCSGCRFTLFHGHEIAHISQDCLQVGHSALIIDDARKDGGEMWRSLVWVNGWMAGWLWCWCCWWWLTAFECVHVVLCFVRKYWNRNHFLIVHLKWKRRLYTICIYSDLVIWFIMRIIKYVE